MSITLDATLKTAQDGINHRPVIKLKSSPAESAIPYRGNNFNTGSYIEENRDLIATSTGRLANLYVRGENLYYYYTNTDRNEWLLPVEIADLADEILSASLCELANNNLGIILVTDNYDLMYMIISQTGSVVTAPTAIQTGLSWLGAPSVTTLANGDYLLVYPQGTGEAPDTANDYYLYKRTASDFTSWGSASALTLTGLTLNNYKNNPHLLQIASDRIFLHFDYLTDYQNQVEINNIYFMYSDNDGSTWSVPEIITNYTDVGSTGTNPVAAEQSGGDVTVAYQEKNAAIYFDETLDGFPGGYSFDGDGLQYDEATKTLVHYQVNNNITQIDTSDNTFVTYWSDTTSPAITTWPSEMLRSQHPYYIFKTWDNIIMVLNVETNTWTEYRGAVDGTGRNGSVSDPNYYYGNPTQYGWDKYAYIHAFVRTVGSEDRLYIAKCSDYNQYFFFFGWIDLAEVPDPITGLYTWHEIHASNSLLDGWAPFQFTGRAAISDFFWVPEISRFCFCSYANINYMESYTNIGIALFNDAGDVQTTYIPENNAGMPKSGVSEAIYMNGSIWFIFNWSSVIPDRRGIGQINLANDTVTYHEANWFSCSANCGFGDLTDMGDGERLLLHSQAHSCDEGGIIIFNTTTFEWTVFNNATTPGLLADDPNPACDVDCDGWKNLRVGLGYDSVTKTIYACYNATLFELPGCGVTHGIVAFSEYGAYSTLKYTTMTNPDSTIDYGAFADLSYYDFEYNLALAVDADGALWLSWNHMDTLTEQDLMWANSLDDKELQDYISIDVDLIVMWDVQKINKLTFSLSHGHLFDPLNYSSIWSVYLKMGRVLILEIGEIVSTVEYLQDQGKFTVKETSLTYGKAYPKINVVAEDMRTLWEDNQIVATEYFSDSTPKTVVENLLIDHGGLTSADYDIPTFVGTHNLFHQFLDISLDEAVQLVLDHFGYFPFVNVDGKFEPRQIDFAGSVDHTYAGAEIIEYSPDSRFATFINKVIVTGMSNLFTEVLYEEESITNVNGTVGHWGGDKDLTVYFSDDRQSTYRNPRLEIVMSVSEFQIWGIKGGGSEQISYNDPDEKYVIITIDIPDLTGILIAAIAALLALGAAAVGCDGVYTGWCGVVIYGIMILLNLILLILGAIANYSYNIWGRPIGHERMTFQADAEDIDFQQQLNGKEISETIDDPFCYTIDSCQDVADFELSVVMAQRRRLKFKKTAHLMDEVGDIIRVNHPYSGEAIDTYVTNLKRVIKFGKNASMIDEFEGWRII